MNTTESIRPAAQAETTTAIFHTIDSGLLEYDGQACAVLGETDPTTYDRPDFGLMLRVRFADGYEADAFADEIGMEDSDAD